MEVKQQPLINTDPDLKLNFDDLVP